MKGVLAVVAAVFFVATEAHAEPEPPTFSLETALAAMKRGQPLLRAATAAVHAAEGDAVTAGHWTNPIVDATYLKAVRRSTYDSVGNPTAGITQFLELAGAPAARRRGAEAEARAAAQDREALVRELSWCVRESFVRLVAAHERVRIRESTVADLEHAATIVRARATSGLAPRYDVSRITIALEQARADLGEANVAVIAARADLDAFVGEDARELVGAPRFDLAALPASLPLSHDATASRRPDVVAARERAVAADQDVIATRRSVFPGFGVRVGAGYGQGPGQVDIGVGIVVPLPIIERGQGSIAAASARADESKERVRALEWAAARRTTAARAELAVRIDAAKAYQSRIGTLNESARVEAEAGYREARLSVLELVDAYQSLRDAQLRLVDLEEAAHVARVTLGRTAGEL